MTDTDKALVKLSNRISALEDAVFGKDPPPGGGGVPSSVDIPKRLEELEAQTEEINMKIKSLEERESTYAQMLSTDELEKLVNSWLENWWQRRSQDGSAQG